MGRAVIPPGLLFALGLLRADWWVGPDFPKVAISRERHMQLNIPECFAFIVLPSQQATFTPVFPGCPLRTAVRFDPDSYGDHALPWNPNTCESLCAPFKNGVSVSPSHVELLHTSPTGLQCQKLQGLFLPVPDPHVWDFGMGLRTLTSVGESLWTS